VKGFEKGKEREIEGKVVVKERGRKDRSVKRLY
jgi:hypothetical protein